jgi:ketosteroid isomerase-like protein
MFCSRFCVGAALLLGAVLPTGTMSLYVREVQATPASTAVKSALTKRYAAFDRAAKTKNVSAISAMQAADFMHIDKRGNKRNRAQHAQALRGALSVIHNVQSCVSKIESVQVNNGKATAIVRSQMTAQVRARNGKMRIVKGATRSRDVWIQTPKGWLVQRSQDLSETVTVDGKKVR